MKLVARSRAMREVLQHARRYAAADANLLITGETGVGKDALARFVHDAGTRRRLPFITIDCAALPATLVESELFGHERGAFTDAAEARPGRFEAAGGGTVYLDAVSSLPLPAQGALLRIVEERCTTRLGGSRLIDLPARLVVSAQSELEHEVRRGAFRADLFHRLRVLTLSVPPLRERPDDIMPLATSFLAGFAARLRRRAPSLSHEAEDALLRYRWPGNIRELHHVLERALVAGVGDAIEAAALPIEVLESGEAYLAPVGVSRPTLEDVERRYITLTLSYVRGSQTRAAAILGISRKALWEKRKRFGIA